MGHALSVGRDITPGWWIPPSKPDPGQFSFFSVSWHYEDKRYVPRLEEEFPLRPQVVYYLRPKLRADQMAPVYAELGKTNFPTLYAATNPFDDFAESFASYVHTVLMHRPFEIRISTRGKDVEMFRICWSESRCAIKRQQLEKVLASVKS
jgi:hypothetical protein